jgi:DNA-binding transcriptional ArsR family regulator
MRCLIGITMIVTLEVDFLSTVCDKIKTLGHPLRIQIVERLEKGDSSVSEIMNYIGVSQPVTSQHLLLMKRKGILKSHRKGNSIVYSIKDAMTIGLHSCLRRSQEKNSQENHLGVCK